MTISRLVRPLPARAPGTLPPPHAPQPYSRGLRCARVPTKLASVVLFDVDASLPQRVLTEATQAGLAAARATLAPDASAEATGSLASARDERRRVRVDLTLRVPDPAAALRAERAFADAFLARVRTRDAAADRA